MIAAKQIVSAFRSLQLGNKMALMAATVSVFGVLGAASVTGSASAQTNSNNGPTVRSDCRNWRSYPQNFDNRADCNDFVDALNANNNGYGGGGNGGGGGLGGFIGRLFSFLSNLFQLIASFFSRLF